MPTPTPTPTPLTYIPPLLDGASGTTPHAQHPLLTTLHHELTQTLPILPTLCRALLLHRLLPHRLHPHPVVPASWADTAETALYFLLACFEVEGGGAWWWGVGNGWMMGQEVVEDEKVAVLGGDGDERCFSMPSQVRRTLYSQMRSALLDDSMNRCVVLCHNDSAVIVSQAVTQLCADLPSEKLRKLEIYTFGAAASEFMMPLGDKSMEPESVHHAGDHTNERRGIHIEHFAMTKDPFAQMGVLQSVGRNMKSRFCGGVFVMNDTTPTMQTARPKVMPTCSGYSHGGLPYGSLPKPNGPGQPHHGAQRSRQCHDHRQRLRREARDCGHEQLPRSVPDQKWWEAAQLDRACDHGPGRRMA
ncbi:hypothetical protein CHGG_08769 [Chaetomium globosum CBS 148.51]|uniref:Uncharacterized protein n=1 Tax=Chaetomium globosum (strain ATCC 6205 / CBS 148.51 / DSM 1962 / NBRC 6347 / NRRL 1970) TaxID=306901 RepID=Q2GTD5_CHAGB|nr:uncharacterized protein CHGG_08769 [Chaetomium globosum CBS 148.51]EAQ84755.1 hypothetical protein CHGG_08769 [Chaetomium globosum CBS 148.51]